MRPIGKINILTEAGLARSARIMNSEKPGESWADWEKRRAPLVKKWRAIRAEGEKRLAANEALPDKERIAKRAAHVAKRGVKTR